MTRLRLAAPAKVNLSLKVIGRRADGRHELDSLVVFAAAADALSVEPAPSLSLEVSGPFAAALEGESDNLVLRAARLVDSGAGARLHLVKQLPVAAGLGGGSSDAAAALKLLARLWNRPLPRAAAMELGADLPVCLDAVPARLRGIGERIDPLVELPAFWLLLVNPGIALSTAEVFRAYGGGFSAGPEMPDGFRDLEDLLAYLRASANDLEGPAQRLCPEIATVLTRIAASPGCRMARMSGSGASCFGLYATAEEAEAAAAGIAAAQPGWWVRAAALHAAEKPS